MASSLHVRLLGDFQLHVDEMPVIGAIGARLQSLLAYLILHRDVPQSRQYVAFLFWPDTTEKQALTNLRKLLHLLRRSAPEVGQYLEADAQGIAPQRAVTGDRGDASGFSRHLHSRATPLTFSVLARASDSDESSLVRDLDELWRRRIIRV